MTLLSIFFLSIFALVLYEIQHKSLYEKIIWQSSLTSGINYKLSGHIWQLSHLFMFLYNPLKSDTLPSNNSEHFM